MIDFHSHFLPDIDDGADSPGTSLSMLRESWDQGVDLIFATPHFYADMDDPRSFLARRNQAFLQLQQAMAEDGGNFPQILLGAEILYFPGMSVADELYDMRMGQSPLLLIEPPMLPWSNTMLDEIEQTGKNLCCIPVIAHVDRYARMLGDDTLFDRALDRHFLVQVNASFFIHSGSSDLALQYLAEDRIHFIGSDCHDMEQRAPNMGPASVIIEKNGLEKQHMTLDSRVRRFLSMTTK